MIIDIIVIFKFYSIDNGGVCMRYVYMYICIYSCPNNDALCYNTDTLYTTK